MLLHPEWQSLHMRGNNEFNSSVMCHIRFILIEVNEGF